MILYLRNQKNDSIAEIEIISDADGSVKYLHSDIYVEHYTLFLVRMLSTKWSLGGPELLRFIHDFANLDEIRGWYYEFYINKTTDYTDVLTVMRNTMKDLAHRYELGYVED